MINAELRNELTTQGIDFKSRSQRGIIKRYYINAMEGEDSRSLPCILTYKKKISEYIRWRLTTEVSAIVKSGDDIGLNSSDIVELFRSKSFNTRNSNKKSLSAHYPFDMDFTLEEFYDNTGIFINIYAVEADNRMKKLPSSVYTNGSRTVIGDACTIRLSSTRSVEFKFYLSHVEDIKPRGYMIECLDKVVSYEHTIITPELLEEIKSNNPYRHMVFIDGRLTYPGNINNVNDIAEIIEFNSSNVYMYSSFTLAEYMDLQNLDFIIDPKSVVIAGVMKTSEDGNTTPITGPYDISLRSLVYSDDLDKYLWYNIFNLQASIDAGGAYGLLDPLSLYTHDELSAYTHNNLYGYHHSGDPISGVYMMGLCYDDKDKEYRTRFQKMLIDYYGLSDSLEEIATFYGNDNISEDSKILMEAPMYYRESLEEKNDKYLNIYTVEYVQKSAVRRITIAGKLVEFIILKFPNESFSYMVYRNGKLVIPDFTYDTDKETIMYFATTGVDSALGMVKLNYPLTVVRSYKNFSESDGNDSGFSSYYTFDGPVGEDTLRSFELSENVSFKSKYTKEDAMNIITAPQATWWMPAYTVTERVDMSNIIVGNGTTITSNNLFEGSYEENGLLYLAGNNNGSGRESSTSGLEKGSYIKFTAPCPGILTIQGNIMNIYYNEKYFTYYTRNTEDPTVLTTATIPVARGDRIEIGERVFGEYPYQQTRIRGISFARAKSTLLSMSENALSANVSIESHHIPSKVIPDLSLLGEPIKTDFEFESYDDMWKYEWEPITEIPDGTSAENILGPYEFFHNARVSFDNTREMYAYIGLYDPRSHPYKFVRKTKVGDVAAFKKYGECVATYTKSQNGSWSLNSNSYIRFYESHLDYDTAYFVGNKCYIRHRRKEYNGLRQWNNVENTHLQIQSLNPNGDSTHQWITDNNYIHQGIRGDSNVFITNIPRSPLYINTPKCTITGNRVVTVSSSVLENDYCKNGHDIVQVPLSLKYMLIYVNGILMTDREIIILTDKSFMLKNLESLKFDKDDDNNYIITNIEIYCNIFEYEEKYKDYYNGTNIRSGGEKEYILRDEYYKLYNSELISGNISNSDKITFSKSSGGKNNVFAASNFRYYTEVDEHDKPIGKNNLARFPEDERNNMIAFIGDLYGHTHKELAVFTHQQLEGLKHG